MSPSTATPPRSSSLSSEWINWLNNSKCGPRGVKMKPKWYPNEIKMVPKRARDSRTETEDSCYDFKGKLLCSFMYKVRVRCVVNDIGLVKRDTTFGGASYEAQQCAKMQVPVRADDFEFYRILINFNPNIDLHLATVLVC